MVKDIYDFLKERIDCCVSSGIDRKRIIVDPGIGFGKTVEHNLQILKNVRKYKELQADLLIGVSRKSVIGRVLDNKPEDRLAGSLALNIWSVLNDVDILRVHDVKETVDAVKMLEAVKKT